MQTEQKDKEKSKIEALVVPTEVEVKKELALREPSTIEIAPGEEKDLDAKADQFVKQLLDYDQTNLDQETARKESVEQMGLDLQRRASKQSELLKQPIKTISKRSDDKGDVGNALLNLKVKIEELDPGKLDLQPGWFSRTLGRIPGIGNSVNKYFSKYESSQTVISAIVRSLENGRDQLLRDNITLTEDQKQMRLTTIKLEQAVKLGQLIDQKLQSKLGEIPKDEPKYKFIGEELLFPLRQRIMDLQQQLAVNQQGVLASEIIIRNNKELSRGVNRALNVTVTALEVGATVAMALANQKTVLGKVDSVSKTTSDLIAGTASRLKTQGVEIQKQASTAQLNIESLKTAFADIKAAMDDVSNFRINALPQMASTILELDRVSGDAEKSIKKLEEGNKAKPQIKIEVD